MCVLNQPGAPDTLRHIQYASPPVATITSAIAEGRGYVTTASAMNHTDSATNSHRVHG